MQIINYTEAHEAFRENMRHFLDQEILPHVTQWEADHLVPESFWRKMGEKGFLCTDISPEYGGRGGDFLYSVIATEEMMRTNHTGLISPLHSDIVVPYIATYGSTIQKKKYLPGCVSGDIISAVAMTEPDAGSDLASMTTTAVEEGDEVVINGSKTFISNGVNCGLVIIAAKDPEAAIPHKSLSLYLVENGTPGFKKGRQLEKMGMHSQDTAELFFTDCRIPVANRLGEKGQGFIMLMQKLQQERLISALMCQARTEWMLEWTTAYCRKTDDDNQRPLSKRQANQFALAEMATETRISRSFVDKLVVDHMDKKDVVVETSMAKYWTSDLAKRVIGRCMDLVGLFALNEKCPLERAFRDLQVTSIFAGTNEIMKRIISRSLGF
jgi:alkylation response protein AidB-like acyl-CoA dehydrogenase